MACGSKHTANMYKSEPQPKKEPTPYLVYAGTGANTLAVPLRQLPNYTKIRLDTFRKSRYKLARKNPNSATFHPLVKWSPIARRDRVMMGETFKRLLIAMAASSISAYMK